MMNAEPYIGVKAYGVLDLDIIEAVCERLAEVFPFRTEVLAPEPPPQFAFNPARQQYLARAILEDLAQRAPAGAKRMLGLTDKDLFLPILTHVYGEAMLPGVSAVISSFRLAEPDEAQRPRAGFERLKERMVKTAVHELAHTFGLVHCDEAGCVMGFAHTLGHLDAKNPAFCRYCQVLFTDALSRNV